MSHRAQKSGFAAEAQAAVCVFFIIFMQYILKNFLMSPAIHNEKIIIFLLLLYCNNFTHNRYIFGFGRLTTIWSAIGTVLKY